jgi:hypothetical protein
MVLLPYDRDIYKLRGSAAMMEAVCFGRPIVSLRGTAFAEQISWYGLGTVVDRPEEMVDVVFEYAKTPRKKLARRALRGRELFLADTDRAYRAWLGRP